MNTLKNIFKIIGIITLILLIGGAVYLYQSGPKLPKETNQIIAEVMAKPLPKMIRGETGFADNQGIQIWYENILPIEPPKGTVLLLMGISNDAMAWPQKFITAFVDSGYQVIRYDHRGTGMSDWMVDWDIQNSYSITDMAADAVAVLEKLEVQKAHIIGVSMGGMIAQEMAIHFPEKMESLTSIMSSGNIMDDSLPGISLNVVYQLVKVSLKYGLIGGEKNIVKLHLASRLILQGSAEYELNIREITEQVLYNIQQRKGYHSNASKQHQAAVMQAGSRYEQLKHSTIPTMIIHGKSDPFIPMAHGQKCASTIPKTDSLWVEGMGHDIPDKFVALISQKIMANFKH